MGPGAIDERDRGAPPGGALLHGLERLSPGSGRGGVGDEGDAGPAQEVAVGPPLLAVLCKDMDPDATPVQVLFILDAGPLDDVSIGGVGDQLDDALGGQADNDLGVGGRLGAHVQTGVDDDLGGQGVVEGGHLDGGQDGWGDRNPSSPLGYCLEVDGAAGPGAPPSFGKVRGGNYGAAPFDDGHHVVKEVRRLLRGRKESPLGQRWAEGEPLTARCHDLLPQNCLHDDARAIAKPNAGVINSTPGQGRSPYLDKLVATSCIQDGHCRKRLYPVVGTAAHYAGGNGNQPAIGGEADTSFARSTLAEVLAGHDVFEGDVRLQIT